MNDDEVRQFLEDNGYPPHVIEGGRDYLLKRYREFVDEVARGYEYGLHEYRHDLDLRAVIAQLDLNGEVAEEDQLFAAMLVDTDQRVWESMPGDPFWDFGYPHNARGRLRRDLTTAGLAQAQDRS